MFKKISIISIINILTQIIALAGFTITAKFYGLSNIGGLLVVSSYTGIISIASTGYLEQLFFVEKRSNVRRLTFILIFYILLFTLFISFFFLKLLSVDYILFILVNIFSTGLIKLVSTWNISEDRIIFVSYSKLIFAPFIPVISYLLYFFNGSSESGLILVYSISNFIFGIIFTLISFKNKSISFYFSDFRKLSYLFSIQKRYFNFIKFSLTGEFMRTAAFKAPTIVLENYFGKEIAGLYGIANQILLLPITTIIGAISQVYIHKLSTIIQDKKQSIILSLNFLKPIVGISILIILFILFLGDFIISLLFSDDFSELYSVVLILLPYSLSILIASPFLTIFTITERQSYLFKLKLKIFLISIVSFYLAIIMNDFKLGLLIFSVNLFIIYIVYTFLAFRQLKKY
ncbi:MAG: O-antigen/teichoic acid export membrane protein [bacterium]|jgi:O-antigen/teichoic acid export membrane protein